MIGAEIQILIKILSKMPGLGPRSAKRLALFLLSDGEGQMDPMIAALQAARDNVSVCHVCGNLDTSDPCHICTDTRRDPGMLCVVAGIGDLWALERTGSFSGRYHVLGGILSAMDGVGPEDLRIEQLVRRVKEGTIEEIILALSATVDGQATAHYIADRLSGLHVKITKLAHGVPVGGELDFLDDGTIITALKSRA